MALAQLQLAECQHPCGMPIWCHTTQPGEACYDYIDWLLKNNNTQEAPEALHRKKNIKSAQKVIHESMPGCGCPVTWPVESRFRWDLGGFWPPTDVSGQGWGVEALSAPLRGCGASM